MSKRIKSIKGLFGQIIHYKDGVKVGESWPGLFKGSQNHYDADGKYIGYSERGMITDLAHHRMKPWFRQYNPIIKEKAAL